MPIVQTTCVKIRSDVESEDVETVFPDLPKTTDWNQHREFVKKRLKFQEECDNQAYACIKHIFPEFKPPRQN